MAPTSDIPFGCRLTRLAQSRTSSVDILNSSNVEQPNESHSTLLLHFAVHVWLGHDSANPSA
jgi:hypothetical protein